MFRLDWLFEILNNINSGFSPTSSNPITTGSVGIGIIDEIRLMRKSP